MMYHEKEEWIMINGTKLFVSVRSQKKDLPLLVYLHGGPGDAAYPLLLKYNRPLENAFTMVVFEQRGAGKSYYPFKHDEEITIDTYVEDVYQLISLLVKTYHQEKVYLVGHSWGSVIGLKFIKKYPHLVHKYIGLGQVVHMVESSRLAWEFAIEKNKQKGKHKLVKVLESIDYHYEQENWFSELLFTTNQVVKHKGSLYGRTNYNHLIKTFIFSRSYSLKDLIQRQKGARQSILRLWPELMTVNFESDVHFDVPIVFIEGKDDYHVSKSLCWKYYQSITSEKTFIEFEKSAHFPQWSESDKFNQTIMKLAE